MGEQSSFGFQKKRTTVGENKMETRAWKKQANKNGGACNCDIELGNQKSKMGSTINKETMRVIGCFTGVMRIKLGLSIMSFIKLIEYQLCQIVSDVQTQCATNCLEGQEDDAKVLLAHWSQYLQE